jgi:hypothetical protein
MAHADDDTPDVVRAQVLVLGSVTVARPHLINIKGYPAGLSVLDFLELAEAGKTFDKVLHPAR